MNEIYNPTITIHPDTRISIVGEGNVIDRKRTQFFANELRNFSIAMSDLEIKVEDSKVLIFKRTLKLKYDNVLGISEDLRLIYNHVFTPTEFITRALTFLVKRDIELWNKVEEAHRAGGHPRDLVYPSIREYDPEKGSFKVYLDDLYQKSPLSLLFLKLIDKDIDPLKSHTTNSLLNEPSILTKINQACFGYDNTTTGDMLACITQSIYNDQHWNALEIFESCWGNNSEENNLKIWKELFEEIYNPQEIYKLRDTLFSVDVINATETLRRANQF